MGLVAYEMRKHPQNIYLRHQVLPLQPTQEKVLIRKALRPVMDEKLLGIEGMTKALTI